MMERIDPDDANRLAKEWMSYKDVLHDLDMVVGGHAHNITGLGDAGINGSLGSQWRKKFI